MFNSFEQFNMSSDPGNSIENKRPTIENKPPEPNIDNTMNAPLKPSAQLEDKASAPIEKASPDSGKLVGVSESSRDSAIFKIVGIPNKKVEEGLMENLRHIFKTQPINESVVEKKLFSNKTFKEIERPATIEEAEMIRIINQNMAEFVRQYGGRPLNINIGQVHFIDEKKINKKISDRLELDRVAGYYSGHDQSVVVGPRVSLSKLLTSQLSRAQTLAHELMHFNSFQSVQYDPELSNKIRYRKCGIAMFNSNNNIYFGSLDEAVTEELAIRFGKKYFNQIPNVKEEFELTERHESAIKDAEEKASESSALYTLPPDVGSVGEDGKTYRHGYFEERQALGWYIRIIFERNPEKFQSEEEVFGVFAKAYFTGKTLELARLIEKSFPVKGAFRRTGKDKAYQKSRKLKD